MCIYLDSGVSVHAQVRVALPTHSGHGALRAESVGKSAHTGMCSATPSSYFGITLNKKKKEKERKLSAWNTLYF